MGSDEGVTWVVRVAVRIQPRVEERVIQGTVEWVGRVARVQWVVVRAVQRPPVQRLVGTNSDQLRLQLDLSAAAESFGSQFQLDFPDSLVEFRLCEFFLSILFFLSRCLTLLRSFLLWLFTCGLFLLVQSFNFLTALLAGLMDLIELLFQSPGTFQSGLFTLPLDSLNLLFDLPIPLLSLTSFGLLLQLPVALEGLLVVVVIVHQFLPQSTSLIFQTGVLLGGIIIAQFFLGDLPKALLIAGDLSLVVFELSQEIFRLRLVITLLLTDLGLRGVVLEACLGNLLVVFTTQGSARTIVGALHILP